MEALCPSVCLPGMCGAVTLKWTQRFLIAPWWMTPWRQRAPLPIIILNGTWALLFWLTAETCDWAGGSVNPDGTSWSLQVWLRVMSHCRLAGLSLFFSNGWKRPCFIFINKYRNQNNCWDCREIWLVSQIWSLTYLHWLLWLRHQRRACCVMSRGLQPPAVSAFWCCVVKSDLSGQSVQTETKL